MEYPETTKTDSYKDYTEGNPNVHPSENWWKKVHSGLLFRIITNDIER